MAQLAGVVRSLREDAAITQEELAERAGVSARTISDIERGLRKRVYRDTAQRLGRALTVPEDELDAFVELARGRAGEVRRELDAEFRRRFVSWHVDRVSALAGHVGSEEQWYDVLDADQPNLTVALRWADEAGDSEAVLQLCAGLWRYWQARGDLALGRRWLELGLRADPPASLGARMTALWGLAWLAFQQGEDDVASDCAHELGRLAGPDMAGELRNAATLRGIVALARNQVAVAMSELTDAVRLARELGEPWVLATSLLNLAMASIAAGDTAAAVVLLQESMRGYTELGDERFRARSLSYLGLASLVDGDADHGASRYAESLAIFDEVGELKGLAEALTGLATAAAMRGAPLRAAVLAGAAERMRESFAGRPLPVERRVAEAAFARARTTVTDAQWNDAWTSGRALREEDAVTAALDAEAG